MTTFDSDNDGRPDLVGVLAAVPGFLSAATSDVLRILTVAASVLTLALTLWNAMHPVAAVEPEPVTVPAKPAPAEAPADTDQPAPEVTP